jgi:ABC-type lipoprotein release transport system permease subunit
MLEVKLRMASYALLLKLFSKPEYRTFLSIVMISVLTIILWFVIAKEIGHYVRSIMMVTIFVAISALALNEIVASFTNRRRDIAILIAVGIWKHLIGGILILKTIVYASIGWTLGMIIAYLLGWLGGISNSIPSQQILLFAAILVLGPTIVAGISCILHISRFNVPEVLRQ